MRKFLLTAVFALIAALVFAQERIAVFPFEDRGNVLTQDEAIRFYRTFYNEFTNQSAGRFSLVPLQEIERLISTEAVFQHDDFFKGERMAAMMLAQNAAQILSGTIGRLGNNIGIFIYIYKYPQLVLLPGGTSLIVTNTDELFNKIPELVQNMHNEITRVTNIPDNFVRIQGGTFLMGSPSSEPRHRGEEIQHQVTVNSFYMGIYEVTQREYQEVMGTNPSYYRGDNLPVEKVSWYDAVEYCNRRSESEGLTPAYSIDKRRRDPNNRNILDFVEWLIILIPYANGYRLPTEAEWEYACRAGTVTPFSTGDNITTSLANYDGRFPYNSDPNEDGMYRQTTTEVGSFEPNLWGLYDMHGNVWEWCWDWYGNYSEMPQTDPMGAVSGSRRVIRGGAWNNSGQFLRSAYRSFNDSTNRGSNQGFRLVRNAQ